MTRTMFLCAKEPDTPLVFLSRIWDYRIIRFGSSSTCR